MSIDAILDASRAGLQNERLRIDLATRKIAGANQPVNPLQLREIGNGFSAMLNGVGMGDSIEVPTRSVFDPAHPQADAQGRVHYPLIDLATEMTNLLAASRGYEANVRAFNILRGMVLRSIELGAR